jgi:hypothetical protein
MSPEPRCCHCSNVHLCGGRVFQQTTVLRFLKRARISRVFGRESAGDRAVAPKTRRHVRTTACHDTPGRSDSNCTVLEAFAPYSTSDTRFRVLYQKASVRFPRPPARCQKTLDDNRPPNACVPAIVFGFLHARILRDIIYRTAFNSADLGKF